MELATPDAGREKIQSLARAEGATVSSGCARLGSGLFEGFPAWIGQNETGDRRSEEEEDKARRRAEKRKSDPEGGNSPRRSEADQVSGPDAVERASRARRGPALSQYGRKQVLSGTQSQQSPAHSRRGGLSAGGKRGPGD